jgi:hypothetical protein
LSDGEWAECPGGATVQADGEFVAVRVYFDIHKALADFDEFRDHIVRRYH